MRRYICKFTSNNIIGTLSSLTLVFVNLDFDFFPRIMMAIRGTGRDVTPTKFFPQPDHITFVNEILTSTSSDNDSDTDSNSSDSEYSESSVEARSDSPAPAPSRSSVRGASRGRRSISRRGRGRPRNVAPPVDSTAAVC